MMNSKKNKSVIYLYRLLTFFMVVVLCTLISNYEIVSGEIGENTLFSKACCLMDADTGRVLYSKNGNEVMPMASTTKIMTCILAIEIGNMDDMVEITSYAASMPKVKLGAKEGECYKLEDLLYCMMLESYNDASVAVAEHIAGSVENFAELMNAKARDLQCYNTYFITPNGLDATREINGKVYSHSTTAEDLCRIMAYCEKNEKFIEITNQSSYSFTNQKTDSSHPLRSFTVNNKNAFLNMMDGVTSGKTGFTNEAGYCYVCSFELDGKRFVVSLLGCGWPNNKTYKWKDARFLLEYGMNNYNIKTLNSEMISTPEILIKNGVLEDKIGDFKIKTSNNNYENDKLLNQFNILVSKDDKLYKKIEVEDVIYAPIEENQIVGHIYYYINEDIYYVEELCINYDIEEYTLEFCIKRVLNEIF